MRRTLRYGFLLFVLLLFPFGPLFPWSPWKPGYDHVRLVRADVYYPTGHTLPEPYRDFDALIAQSEANLQFTSPKRITVVLTKDWSDFLRFQVLVRGHGVAAVTLATGTEIYVSPKLDEKQLDHREYLLHELGHALMNQHQSMLNGYRQAKVYWLAEGVCVWNGQQKSYFTRDEFLAEAKHTKLLPVMDGTNIGNMRFAYPTWRYFIEYLIAKKGRDQFQQFLLQAKDQPQNWRALFNQTYQQSFEDAVNNFETTLK